MAHGGDNRVLTFDVGGSHISAALCFGDDLSLGPVASAHYGDITTSDGFVGLLYDLAAKATGGNVSGIGATLAVPSPFDFEAGVSLMRHKLQYLYGFDLRHALAARLGSDPNRIRFLNDADAYLLGEVGAGAAKGFARAIGLTLGTGIGSAFAVDGRLTTTGPGVPKDGEIWNVPYENGIVEDFVSTRAIAGNYGRRTGKTISVAEIAAAVTNDSDAQEAFAEFGHHLGQVIGSLLADFRADVVVLGGGISRSADLFLPITRAEIPNRTLQIRVSELLDRAPLVGCAVATFAALRDAKSAHADGSS
ncbi:MAG: ROK family protein [Terracidiphilus sp.]